MSEKGSFATELDSERHVRFTTVSDRTADIAGGPVRANTGPSHHHLDVWAGREFSFSISFKR
jgi:hypothetical protein